MIWSLAQRGAGTVLTVPALRGFPVVTLAERFVRSIRQECLDRMVFFGEASLRRAVTEFVSHYNRERNHQGLDSKIIQPEFSEFPASGTIRRHERLGGLLNYCRSRRPCRRFLVARQSYQPSTVPFERGSAAPVKPFPSGLRAMICETEDTGTSVILCPRCAKSFFKPSGSCFSTNNSSGDHC